MAGLRTEFSFTLPKGYVDDDGTRHRDGVMRLATARDEIEPLRDRSIDGPDDPYLTILVLSRVVTRLGTLSSIGPEVIEGLFAADLAFLQDLYGIVNFGNPRDVAALQASVLPDDETDETDDEVETAGTAASDHRATGDADDEFGIVTLPDDDELAGGPADAPDPAPVRSARRRGRIEEVSSSHSS